MSRLSPDTVRLHVGLHGYALRVDSARHEFVWSAPLSAHDGRTLCAALDALNLAGSDGCKRLEVSLGNAWIRYQLVRYPKNVSSREERNAFLKAVFFEVYGAEAESFHIIAEPGTLGLPVLACALNAAFLQSIQQVAARHKLKLHSVRGAFVSRFNSLRPHLSGDCGAFADVDEGRVNMGVWLKGEWCLLRSQPFLANAGNTLGSMLSQMLATNPAAAIGGKLHVMNQPADAQPLLPQGWSLIYLPKDVECA